MKHKPSHTVVTPCLNPGNLLRETVQSVVDQQAVMSGRVKLDYRIVDGGSTDGTREFLKTLRHPDVRWISEPDEGLYDALAKGFADADGDVHSYLNAGDLYHPNAFDIVADTIRLTDGWITGMSVVHNQRGDVITARMPLRYRRRWFQRGLYGRVLPFLQQESTFWTGELAQALDLSEFRTFRLAGDAYLWSVLSEVADLTIVSAHLGGFRQHEGQLSRDLDTYRAEMRRFAETLTLGDRALALVDRVLSHAPVRLKHRLSRGRMIIWDRHSGWTKL